MEGATLEELRGHVVGALCEGSCVGGADAALLLRDLQLPRERGAPRESTSARAAWCGPPPLLGVLRALAWEKLHTGRYDRVALAWRELFGLVQLCGARWAQSRQHGEGGEDGQEEESGTAMRELDVGLLMAGPLLRGALQTEVEELQAKAAPSSQPTTEEEQEYSWCPFSSWDEASAACGLATEKDCDGGAALSGIAQVERVTALPSLERFLLRYMQGEGQAVVLEGAAQEWPALSRWRNPRYLLRVAGQRTVPVEVGEHYLHPEWTQQLQRFDRFLQEQLLPSADSNSRAGGRRGYLAQCPLLEQVAALAGDVREPEYVALSQSSPSSSSSSSAAAAGPRVNCWFGPAGTVTPLHQDPTHNLLYQLVGRKRVRLYHPRESERLYPHQEPLLRNASRLPVELFQQGEEACLPPQLLEHFPRFAEARYLECELRAGDALYIPPLHWHFVEALSQPSLSVSFWWS